MGFMINNNSKNNNTNNENKNNNNNNENNNHDNSNAPAALVVKASRLSRYPKPHGKDQGAEALD